MDVTAATQTMGKDAFLKLLTSQLKYQDPLNPTDSTQFTAQLAQFSSLEQLTNISDGITQLLAFQDSLNNGMVTGFIGKTVVTQDGTTGKVTGVSFDSGVASLMLDNGNSCKISDVKQISETI